MNFKLDKKKMQTVAVVSSALALMPTQAYAAVPNMENIPSHLGGAVLILGGISLLTLREIRKEERERLYEIHENLIPAQKKALKYLKSAQNNQNKRRINYEINSEIEYLKYLKEKRSELCESLNIDETQMEDFIEKERIRQEENILMRSKNKIKTLLVR